MRLLSKDKLEIQLFDSGHYDESGEWIEGGYRANNVLYCCIQPDFSGNTRIIEQMGVRSEDCLTVHTRQKLKTSNEITGEQADQIVYNGAVYEVAQVKYWSAIRRLSHYQVLAVRQDKDYANGSA